MARTSGTKDKKPDIEKLEVQKDKLIKEIADIRNERGILMHELDLAHNGHRTEKDSVTLSEELFKINKKLNKKRDALDDVNYELSKARGYY